VWQRRQQ